MNVQTPSPVPAPLVETRAASIRMALPQGRLSLRARAANVPALGAALGLTLPERIGQRASSEGIEALRLGPDEWVILSPADAVAGLQAACAGVYADHPHSLTDISGREVTVLIEGPQAAELLTIGCPRDIATIPTGEARRTLFDGASVILWRDGDNAFRMDIWNSFVDHLGELLKMGARELAAAPG